MSISEISKIFKQDISEKKRAGSGSFHRKGKGVKHGIVGGMRTAYDFLPTREKKKLNGVVTVIKLSELMNLDELSKFDKEKQKEILTKWRSSFSSKEIYKHLGLKESQYYSLLYDLGVLESPNSKKGKGRQPLTDATINDIMPYDAFEELSILNKYELMVEWGKKFNTESIAKIWGKSVQNYYAFKSGMKKKYNKIKQQEQTAKEIESEKKSKSKNSESDLFSLNAEENNEIEQTSENDNVVNNEKLESENISQETENFKINENNVSPSNEIDEIKQLVLAQNQAIQELMQNQIKLQQQSLDPVKLQESQQTFNPYVAATTFNTTQHESNLINTNSQTIGAMTFSYKDVKEGFLLYQDVKRFIAMLEKNPDEFEVEIKISRKE